MTEQSAKDLEAQATDEESEASLAGSWSEVTDPIDPAPSSASQESGASQEAEVSQEAEASQQASATPERTAKPAAKTTPNWWAVATARPEADTSRRPAAKPDSGDKQRSQQSPDLVAGLQRWLIKSSARSVRREFQGQMRKTFSAKRDEPGNAWDVATTEAPPELGQAPECAWCPICQAARRMRESGPGLGSQLSGAGDAVAAAVQSAVAAFEAALGRPGSAAQPPADRRPPANAPDETGQNQEESPHEPDDRG